MSEAKLPAAPNPVCFDRRSEPRLLCSDLVVMVWCGAGGEECRESVNLEDISDHGFCVQVGSEIPAGAEVALECRGAIFHGEVRYSRPDVLGWFAGVQMKDGSRWVREVFTPDHLFDPRSLDPANDEAESS